MFFLYKSLAVRTLGLLWSGTERELKKRALLIGLTQTATLFNAGVKQSRVKF